MIVTDEFTLDTVLAEVRQLRVVHRLLADARRESLHPALGFMDPAAVDDEMARIAGEIEEREDAVSEYTRCETETDHGVHWSHGSSAGRTL